MRTGRFCLMMQLRSTTLVGLIRQLKDASGYSDPNLMVIVRDGMKKVVLSIPFLAACA